jgi:predicted nucleotidyltransferase
MQWRTAAVCFAGIGTVACPSRQALSVIHEVAGVDNIPLRTFLLRGVARFTAAVGGLPGVTRIALVGSLVTLKASPKDADVLVTVNPDSSLDRLAKAGRALKGFAQTRNSGADIFLSNLDDQYIGRICHWRDCRPGVRVACRAQHCGRHEFLNDDLQDVNLASSLVAAPPIELWPSVVMRSAVPADVDDVLLRSLQARE